MTRWLAGTTAIVALFAVIAISFASAQSIWIDETTQLSGLALGLQEQMAWLLGQSNPIPGVPADRMPPLSYWLGSGWSALFGLEEMSMRIFGIAVLACAAPAIVLAAAEFGQGSRGFWAALFALAAVLLTPTVLTQAGEIRAYPLFLSISSWAALAYVKCLHGRGARWLLALGVFSVLAAYTHFFGVVMAFTMWLSLLVWRLIARERVAPVLLGGIASGLAMAGLAPFVLAAVEVSSDGTAAQGLGDLLKDLARLAFRLQLHGVHLSSSVLTAVLLLGTGGLMILALVAVVRRSSGRRGRLHPGAFLILPVILGFVLQALVKLAWSSFDALAPHYSIWMIPLVAIFLSLSLSLSASTWRGLATGLALAVVGTNLIADAILVRHASAFTHGPGEWVAAAIDDQNDTIVIHDAGSNWGSVYFPVYYLTQGRVPQILRAAGTPDRLVLPGGLTDAEAGFADRFKTKLYVRTRSLSSADLSRRLKQPGDCGIPPMTAVDPQLDRVSSRCAYESSTMVVTTR